jgi:RNA recognition motif-containing protein
MSSSTSGDRFYSWRNRIVFVSNLPFGYKAQDLLLLFRQFGRCFRVDLARNHQDGRSRGFCYVEFERQEHAKIAVTYLDNAEVEGRFLRAEIAQFPPDELLKVYFPFLIPDTKQLLSSALRRTATSRSRLLGHHHLRRRIQKQ